MKEEKLRKQKEEYLELRNELLEKGYTTDEITEYLYNMADYNFNVSGRRICNYALVSSGILLSFFAIACSTIGNARDELVGYIGLTTMLFSAFKSLAEESYLNKQISSYKLMKNIEKTVEMREVKRTNVNLEQNLQEEYENSEKVFTKQYSKQAFYFDDDEEHVK